MVCYWVCVDLILLFWFKVRLNKIFCQCTNETDFLEIRTFRDFGNFVSLRRNDNNKVNPWNSKNKSEDYIVCAPVNFVCPWFTRVTKTLKQGFSIKIVNVDGLIFFTPVSTRLLASSSSRCAGHPGPLSVLCWTKAFCVGTDLMRHCRKYSRKKQGKAAKIIYTVLISFLT